MKAQRKKPGFFEWADAWVCTSLVFQPPEDESGKVIFTKFMWVADFLNHAIISADEVRRGLVKLHQRGLVVVRDKAVYVTPLLEGLFEKVRGMRGGLLSVVDNTLKVLNSRKTVLPVIDEKPNVQFVNRRSWHRVYEDYQGEYWSHLKKGRTK